MAASSLSEVGYGLHAARRLGYIDDAATSETFEERVRMVAGPLYGLIRSYRMRSALASGASVIAIVIGLASALA